MEDVYAGWDEVGTNEVTRYFDDLGYFGDARVNVYFSPTNNPPGRKAIGAQSPSVWFNLENGPWLPTHHNPPEALAALSTPEGVLKTLREAMEGGFVGGAFNVDEDCYFVAYWTKGDLLKITVTGPDYTDLTGYTYNTKEGSLTTEMVKGNIPSALLDKFRHMVWKGIDYHDARQRKHIAKYQPGDLPIGTVLVSHKDPKVLGTVTLVWETRGMPEVFIEWANGNTSVVWVHQCTNEKAATP